MRRGSGRCKTQPPTAVGLFSKDRFAIDLDAETVTCPAGLTAPIRAQRRGRGRQLRAACAPVRSPASAPTPPAAARSPSARTRRLADARARQADPTWVADYRATRPKVERKIAHLMRRRHGGRRARVRGTGRVAADFALLAAAVNLARLGVLGLRGTTNGWAIAT